MSVGDGSVLRVRWRLPPSPHASAAGSTLRVRSGPG